MRKNILFLLVSSLILLVSCHKPDTYETLLGETGINTVSAQFSNGEYKNDATAKFTTTVNKSNIEEIVIDVPYFYPESSTNETSIEAMRITASLDNNCTITPGLSTLDLSKKNYFELTLADGSTKKICITGRRKKSDKCQILSFSLSNPTLSGVVDEDAKTISLISLDDIDAGVAEVVLSPHATISPDPATARSYNGEVKFTVTAYDGVTKATYTVSKVVPPKVKYGWRAGSENELWVKDLTQHYSLANGANKNHTLGVIGNDLILSDAIKQYRINAITGELIGELPWSMNLNGGAITSDKAGNLLLCNIAAKGAAFTIYTTNDITKAPVQLTTMTYSMGIGVKMGMKISVSGDITKDAIITVPTWAWANPPSHSEFIRWVVKDGVVGLPEAVVPVSVSRWNGGNVDVAYATTDITKGNYFVTSYSGTGNKLDALSAGTNQNLGQLATPTWGANSNYNAVDAVEFNGALYTAVYGGMHFTYSQCVAFMQDVTTLTGFTGTIQDSPSTVWESAQYKFGNPVFASSDIIMIPSSDGYKLKLFYTDGNCRSLVAWEFDCIDK